MASAGQLRVAPSADQTIRHEFDHRVLVTGQLDAKRAVAAIHQRIDQRAEDTFYAMRKREREHGLTSPPERRTAARPRPVYPRGMVLRPAATVPALALAIGAGVVGTSAHAQGSDAAVGDRVSREAYLKVEEGMTRARLANVVDNATFTTEDAGTCSLRRYTGWDRDHIKVYVLLDQDREVAYKTTADRSQGVSFFCD